MGLRFTGQTCPMLGTESCEVLPFPLLRLHPREGLGQVPAALRCPNLPRILHCSPELTWESGG